MTLIPDPMINTNFEPHRPASGADHSPKKNITTVIAAKNKPDE